MTDLERLIRPMAEELGTAPPDLNRAEQRSAVLRALDRHLPATRKLPMALAAAPVALMVGFAVISSWPPPTPIAFVVGSQADPGYEGMALTTADVSTSLKFADGSELELAPKSGLTVARASASDVALAVNGRLHARVHPHAGVRWVFAAGSYQVRVTGTELSVTWHPSRGLDVEVQHGSVRVTGERLLAAGIEVGGGQRLSIPAESATPELTPIATAPGVTPTLPQVTQEPRPTPAVTASADGAPPADSAKAAWGNTWKNLALSGDYPGAVRELRKQGANAIVARADLSELASIAEVARIGGDSALAERALERLYREHSKSAYARTAAFLLGRLRLEQHRDYAGALRWLETYLKDNPEGELAEEARGRILEALTGQGDRVRAREAAEEYVRLYPRGDHATFARSLLAEP